VFITVVANWDVSVCAVTVVCGGWRGVDVMPGAERPGLDTERRAELGLGSAWVSKWADGRGVRMEVTGGCGVSRLARLVTRSDSVSNLALDWAE